MLDGAPGTRHGRIGVVLDSLALSRDWTAVSAARSLGRFYPDWDQGLLDDLLARLDVPARVKIKDLSRGQGVKLALALALAHRPELLILDEPTSGLDPVARLEVLDILHDFLVAEGRTVLFSTHITSDLERIADHLHIIGAGRTRFAGPCPTSSSSGRWPADRLRPDPRGRGRPDRNPAQRGGRLRRGCIRTADTAVFGPDVLIEPPSIDEAVVA